MGRTIAFLSIILAAALMPGTASAREPSLDFALLGDVPSFRFELPLVERLLTELDADLAFAIHVGDLKGSRESCSDALLAERQGLLGRSVVPLVYLPGDNDWADCHLPQAGSFDPHERLDALRRLFFPSAAKAVLHPASHPHGLAGRALHADSFEAFVRQADIQAGGPPENLRWRTGPVLFATLNLPGSGNARVAERHRPGSRAERAHWNDRWLDHAFEIAARDSIELVVIAAHANPRFGSTDHPAYADFRDRLLALADRHRGHTLFLHGDTHRHRIERLGERLVRVESHGSPFSTAWVRIEVRAGSDEPFRIRTRSSHPQPLPQASAQPGG